MNDKFEEYLLQLEMPEAIRDRVRRAHDFYGVTLGVDIKHIFVSDRTADDETRVFESVWFFTDIHAMEAHDFLSRDDFDAALTDEIYFWRVESSNFNFKEATADSRMILNYDAGLSSGTLIATGNNCDSLMRLVIEFFAPNTGGLISDG